MSKRLFACLALVSAGLLAACAETPLGPAAPGEAGPPQALGPAGPFDARDFAWSLRPGDGGIHGVLGYRASGQRFSCDGGDVILTPETAWSRRRMVILYGSATAAAIPVSIVRARTPSAPAGAYARFVRKATCDGANRFTFDGLPDGAWFVLTVARPAGGEGETMAIMRRVDVRGDVRMVSLGAPLPY